MNDTKNKEILIIGAGSTGLSSALFLYEKGFRPRITEKRTEPSKITKALGINPKTLQLLEKTEVTKRFLENGWKLQCFSFWCNDKLVYKNYLAQVKHPYPFMLVQPQSETEGIIEEALAQRGIFVERGLGLENLIQKDREVQLFFKNNKGVSSQVNTEGIVIGADGHKSKVRESTGIGFKGWEHHEEFKLYDVELETPVSQAEGHYRFYKEGGMLMLHIRDGVWRVGGTIPDAFNYLPKGTRIGKISWETTFTVREKVAEKFSTGNVYLLGDAAHIHSPAGAKGMNLCIEDSYIFSRLLKENRETDYHRVRHPKIRRTVNVIGQLTDKIGGRNFIGNTLRNNMDKLSIFFPLIMPRLRKFLLGLN